MSGYALAVDIGGTFTDAVLRHADGRTWVDKALTTPDDLIDGFFAVVDLALARAGIGPGQVDDVIVHATTTVTNAIIERKGPPTALLVTEGFRDVLYIRDEHRYDMYDPQIEFPDPLVPRAHTFGVAERVLADGRISKPVDGAAVAALGGELARQGIVSVAVCLLNAFSNPENERAIRTALLEAAPDLYVSLSSEVAPQIREYLRASTTVLNAYTEPITRPYLRGLIERLAARGFPNEPLIMLSSGGVIGAELAGRFPVRMIESGPAAGALVASFYADILDTDDLLSFDMGGTTAKSCIIQGREPLVSGRFEVDRRYRFKPGSGMPVIIPAIDMIEIGAGGGSTAWIDDLGLLKVGPESAGSEPGPVCYGRGGTTPTVTDADLVMGILDADNFLGGDMTLDKAAAEAAIAGLGRSLGAGPGETALGIYHVVGESMASAARAHATDRGIDYRGMPLLAFGGAGPVHACYVAELLDSKMVVFPPLASVLSAFGTLVTPLRLDLVRGALSRLSAIDWAEVDALLGELTEEGQSALADAGIAADAVQYSFGADMRYFGQQNEVGVTLDSDPRGQRDIAALREKFEAAYETLYGIRLTDMDVEIVGWRVNVLGPGVDRATRVDLARTPAQPKARRDVLFSDAPTPVDIYDRGGLAEGQAIAGPAIIEERETTVVVLPGWRAQVNAAGCIVATRAG